MPRLIDADALIKAIERGEGFSWDSHGKDDLCVRKKYIDNAPTVSKKELQKIFYETAEKPELKEVPSERPQGKWIPNYTSQFFNPGKQCSLCGKIVEFSENYCPQCGARMEIKT